MAEIPKHLFGTHEVSEKRRKRVLWIFGSIVGISPLGLLIIWVKDDPKFFLMLVLVALVGLLGLSTFAGLRKIKTVTINADEISLLPIGITIKCSDIDSIKITGSKPGRYMIDMRVKKSGLYYYIGSFDWVGKAVSIPLF